MILTALRKVSLLDLNLLRNFGWTDDESTNNMAERYQDIEKLFPKTWTCI